MPDFCLSPSVRIKKSETIDLLFSEGERYASRFFYVSYFRIGPAGAAFIAGKKLGGAVLRNRYKRRLREVYRLTPPPRFPLQLLLVARPQLATGRFSEVCAAFSRFYQHVSHLYSS